MAQCAGRAGVVTSLPVCGCPHSRLLVRPLRQSPCLRRPAFCPTQHSQLSAKRSEHRHAAFTVASSKAQTASVFPAGKKQARVKLPACILHVTAQDVLQQDNFEEFLSKAIGGGITGVLLTDVSGSDGAALYEVAGKLKTQLRGRAVLLIADRTDIADAAEADGVVLSSKGESPLRQCYSIMLVARQGKADDQVCKTQRVCILQVCPQL